jgi:hypothetical protein
MSGIPKTPITFQRYAQIPSVNRHIGIKKGCERKERRSVPVETKGWVFNL